MVNVLKLKVLTKQFAVRCIYLCVYLCISGITGPDLQNSDQHHQDCDGVHHASIVGQQSFTAATLPHIELLCVVVVAVVGGVVGHLELDAWSGGAGVTAAERDSIHQILAINIAPNAAKRMRQSVMLVSRYDELEVKER